MTALQISFQSRKQGSFGGSPSGQIVEWITTTWLRFTCSLFSIIIIGVVASSHLPGENKVGVIFAAPLMALVCWYSVLFILLVCRHLGMVGRVLSLVIVIYFFLFSRLVVQPPPRVWLPLA
jgi:hypothetical protein